MTPSIERLRAGNDLGEAQAERLFGAALSGAIPDADLGTMLLALRAKGEHPAEIVGAARALRGAATAFPRPAYRYADCCGTGGDGHDTVNVSTAAAFVAAEAGVPVAKHGNRSASSRCGSADVLEALGARLDPPPAVSRRALDEIGFCFLFAPQFHPAMRRLAPVRRALKVRTIMNLLGPLANPSAPPAQIVGVYDPALIVPMAHALDRLGCRDALVVHGGGLDEIALHDETQAARLHAGEIVVRALSPEEAGVARAPREALAGGDVTENAVWLDQLLGGRASAAHRDAVAIDAGALLWVAGHASSLRTGTAAARATIDSGRARARLHRFIELSHRPEEACHA